jgi:hypothetical protein
MVVTDDDDNDRGEWVGEVSGEGGDGGGAMAQHTILDVNVIEDRDEFGDAGIE